MYDDKTKATRNSSRGRGAAAAALRMDGMTYNEIAQFLGCTPKGARALIERYLSDIAANTTPATRETLRRREDARLDALLHGVWAKALDPKHPEHLVAVRTALQISERRAKMHGTDAPVETIVHTPTTIEIDRWVAEVAGQGIAPVIEADLDIEDAEIIEAPHSSTVAEIEGGAA